MFLQPRVTGFKPQTPVKKLIFQPVACNQSNFFNTFQVSPKKTAKEVNNNSLTKFKEIDDGLASFYFKKPTEEIIPKGINQ